MGDKNQKLLNRVKQTGDKKPETIYLMRPRKQVLKNLKLVSLGASKRAIKVKNICSKFVYASSPRFNGIRCDML